MKRLVCAALTAGLVGAASSASAHWVGANLGESLAEVKASYPEAVLSRDDGDAGPSLTLPAFNLYGVQWNNAKFVFDGSGHLDHVTFVAKQGDYDTIESQVDTAFQAPDAIDKGVVMTNYPKVAPVELRVCQMSDSSIEVTFEPTHLDI